MQKYNLRNTPQKFHLIVVKEAGPGGLGGPLGPRMRDRNKGKTAALAAALPGLKSRQISAAPLVPIMYE